MLKSLRNSFVSWIGFLLIRAIAPTLRYRIHDAASILFPPPSTPPLIFAFWHNRMFLLPYLYTRHFPGRRGACLVSASQDGEMIARILEKFNLLTVRGSSSRRGRGAYRELTHYLTQGCDVAITPDGPRGPRYKAHPGAVGLASLSGNAILPISYHLTWKIEIPSWDRFMIPLPFSRCSVHFGELLRFSNEANPILETKRLEAALHSLENSS